MAAFRCWIVFFVNAAAGFLSVYVAGITLKNVCPGDSVQAFHNIDFDRCNSHVVLKINGERDAQIASWSLQNCTQYAMLSREYKDRVFLDQNGTITIHNLRHFDQGQYSVISKKDTMQSSKEIQINVMTAPRKDRKPLINRMGNMLFASLTNGLCGEPVPTLYWKGDEGFSDTNGPMLKITPGTETRTYYACIQGPALRCAKTQTTLDNCSSFIIEENTIRAVSSESGNKDVLIVVIIFLGILLILAILAIGILFLKRRRRHPGKRQSYKTSMQSAEMQDLLRKEQHSNTVNEFNDPTLRTEKASTKRERIGPYGACCTFCGRGKKVMFILSCEHFRHQYMPACFECGNSYLPRKTCRELHTNEIFGYNVNSHF